METLPNAGAKARRDAELVPCFKLPPGPCAFCGTPVLRPSAGLAAVAKATGAPVCFKCARGAKVNKRTCNCYWPKGGRR